MVKPTKGCTVCFVHVILLGSAATQKNGLARTLLSMASLYIYSIIALCAKLSVSSNAEQKTKQSCWRYAVN